MSVHDKHTPKERDAFSGVETTGHEWDGIKELNNPAPRWWLWVFIITIVWSVGYWVVYPAWPTIAGHTQGKWGWTQYKQLAESQQEILQRRGQYLEAFRNASLEDVVGNPELYAFAVAGGRTAFMENCAACHGTGGEGGKGYPNLNDDDWLWDGTIAGIEQTLRYGIRSGHDEMRDSQMPAFGTDEVLSKDEILQVASYVQSLSDSSVQASAEGATLFADQCSACHAEDGSGNPELGAPNLKDAIWLYGGDQATLVETISKARRGVMPAWENRLSEDTIRQLAIYVHSLGGGR